LFSKEGEIFLNNDRDLSAVITNGNVKLGVFGKGNLGGSGVGINLAGLGDAIMPGCLCEGWGVAGNGIAGGASVHNPAPGNLKLTAFSSTPSTATSRVTLSSLPSLQVTQAYLPAKEAPTALFENRVTITNKGSEAINDIRYTRAMDWDVPPNPFNEYVTIGGREGATNVLYSSNDGFSTVNPLEPKTYAPYYQRTADGGYVLDENGDPIVVGEQTVNTDFVDAGPGDHGAVFDLGFGDLASGSSKTFSIYYGATTSEATALGALANVGAEMYSLGQSSPNGSPGTFIFGFKGVGGEPITVDQPLEPITDGNEVIPPVTGQKGRTGAIVGGGVCAAAGAYVALNGAPLVLAGGGALGLAGKLVLTPAQATSIIGICAAGGSFAEDAALNFIRHFLQSKKGDEVSDDSNERNTAQDQRLSKGEI
jgi:type IV pilus assembly protein PilY1